MDRSKVCGLLETLLALLLLNPKIPKMQLLPSELARRISCSCPVRVELSNGEKRSQNRGPPPSWDRCPRDDYWRRSPPPRCRSPRKRSFFRCQSRSLSRDRRRERSLSRERNHKPSRSFSRSRSRSRSNERKQKTNLQEKCCTGNNLI